METLLQDVRVALRGFRRSLGFQLTAIEELWMIATALITAITFLATTIPATRAARLNPASALQSE